jgi:hypothetical protein
VPPLFGSCPLTCDARFVPWALPTSRHPRRPHDRRFRVLGRATRPVELVRVPYACACACARDGGCFLGLLGCAEGGCLPQPEPGQHPHRAPRDAPDCPRFDPSSPGYNEANVHNVEWFGWTAAEATTVGWQHLLGFHLWGADGFLSCLTMPHRPCRAPDCLAELGLAVSSASSSKPCVSRSVVTAVFSYGGGGMRGGGAGGWGWGVGGRKKKDCS